jgi:hypothetical protein
MKKCLEILLNKIFKSDLELLFGVGSYVIVNYVKYSTNNHTFVVDCKLFINNIELTEGVYPDGLNLLTEESWKFMGIKQNISIVSSIDVI